MKKPEDRPDMQILKTATCPTLSGHSKLTYDVGRDHDGEIHLPVPHNPLVPGSSPGGPTHNIQ